jgi:sodium-dependent phosphate cotransporter
MTLRNAIFIIMGANIGTTVTNTIVALGHMGNPQDFRRAFAAGTVHDFFNILTAATLFPIEYRYRVLERGATVLASWVRASGGLRLASPLDYVVKPVVGLLEGQLPFWLLALSSLACLFLALVVITMAMRTLVVERLQRTIDRYLFRSPGSAFLVGLVLTGVVQSSSVTTSLVVPLAGAGIVALEMVFPYTLGANIGTTVTAFLAAIVTGQELAVTASLCHTLFNVLGCCVWYPLRAAPLGLARGLADLAASNRKLAIAYIVVVFYLVPGVLILALR